MKKCSASTTTGHLLRHHFEGAGITQCELAKKLNVKQSWISRIYDGNFGVRSSTARKLCEMADVPFLNDAPSSKVLNYESNALKIAEELSKLSESEQLVLVKLSKALNKIIKI